MRSSGDGLLGGDSNVDAPSEEEEAGVSPDGPSPAARGGGAKRRPAGFARRLLTAADTTFTDVMSDAIVSCPFPSGALRSVSGRTWELSLSRSRSRRLRQNFDPRWMNRPQTQRLASNGSPGFFSEGRPIGG